MMMRPTTAAAALALVLLASAASAQVLPPIGVPGGPWAQTCGACPEDNGCLCSACRLTPVDMGDAADFVVLGGAGATSTGPTELDGDLGVSFSMTVTGNPTMKPPHAIYYRETAGDKADRAFKSLDAAYTDAANRNTCPISLIGNIGGMTLYPGLYKSSSYLEIDGDDLTLDAAGDPNAMVSTFVIFTDRKVLLANGADADNIFWQAGSSASLYGSSVFEGTMMADQTTTSVTDAIVHGRILARIASVTMDSAKFSLPEDPSPVTWPL
ncbi:hypothetical protein FOA52_013594 [Chlamydomonas sp. UWO 241]|nr:hypothetical protein FOA52_013594 [Chlamydomonas sp. UWO 241]